MRAISQDLEKSDGHNRVDDALLLAFVILVAAALVLYNTDSIASIWTTNHKPVPVKSASR